MSDLGRGPLSAGLMVFKAQLLGAIVQDVARYDVRDIQASIVEREEQQRVRDELLGSLGAVRTFSVGAAIVAGPDGQPDPRLATAVVTADELVLMEAHVAIAPDEIIGRIPLAEITGIRLLDEFGDPVAANDVDPVLELDAPLRRFVVWLERRAEDGSKTSNAFVFLAGSVAREAMHHFERLLQPTTA
jgi:hypothetical protein